MGSDPVSAQLKTQLTSAEPENIQDDELALVHSVYNFLTSSHFIFIRSLAWFIALDQDNSGQISAEELRMCDHFPTE